MLVIIGRVERRMELIKELCLANLEVNGEAEAREGSDGDAKVTLYSFFYLKK